MTSLAIRADGLGKKYRIGRRQAEPYSTLRDAIMRRFSGGDQGGGEDFWALRDVNFEVKHGEVVGIIGRNGAGKSTLLKILSRITEPTEGRVAIRGRAGSLLEVGTGFHPELTGRENVYLNGAILGMRRAEIRSKFDDIVAFAEVDRFLDTPVKRYSNGMYVRLAFAVAAHLEPELLVVDEVLAVGDATFQKKCLGRMGEVAKGGRTVLFVSHDMVAIEKICNRTLLIQDGGVRHDGLPRETIDIYLSTNRSGHGTTPRGSLAFSHDGSISLNSVSCRSATTRTSIIHCGDDTEILLAFHAERRFANFVVAIGINTSTGTRIAALHSEIAGNQLDDLAGARILLCRIHRNALSPGSYTLDVKVYSNGDSLLAVQGAGVLTVESGPFHPTGRLPDPSWGGTVQMTSQWAWQTCDESLPSGLSP